MTANLCISLPPTPAHPGLRACLALESLRPRNPTTTHSQSGPGTPPSKSRFPHLSKEVTMKNRHHLWPQQSPQ